MSQYEAVVYFSSPRTQWAQKVQDEDVIFRRAYPWRWLARVTARSTHRNLDATRCGYAVLNNGRPLEHIEALPIAASDPDGLPRDQINPPLR